MAQALGSDTPVDEMQALREETSRLLVRLEAAGHGAAAAALGIAVEALDEALLRLGVPLAGKGDDAQEDPLVLRVEPWVRPDE